MSLLDNIPFINRNRAKQPAAAPIPPSNQNSYEDSIAARLSAGGASVTVNGRPLGVQYTDEEIEQIYQGYVFGAIRKLANKTAEVLSDHYETLKDGEETEERHPYLEAVNNSKMDNRQFWHGIATYVIILGEAFVFTGERKMMAGNVKPVEKFELLQSNKITRGWNEDGTLRNYQLKHKKPGMTVEAEQLYLPDNIIPITDFNPWEMGKGYGLIRPILDKVALEAQATKLQQATIGNTIKAPGIISASDPKGGEMDARLFTDLEAKVRDRWTSNDMDKAGTPIVGNGGAITYESIDQDWEKLSMKSIREMNRESFFAALGVSKTILGIETSGVTRDTSRVMTENFILDMVMPIASGIISAFNQDFINNYPMLYEQGKLKISLNAPIEKDLATEKSEADIAMVRANAFKQYKDAGVEEQKAAKLAGIDEVLFPADGEETAAVEVKPDPPVAGDEPAPADDPAAPTTVIHNHVHNHAAPQIPEKVVNRLPKKTQKQLVSAKKKLEETVTKLDHDLGMRYAKELPTNAAPKKGKGAKPIVINAVSEKEQNEYEQALGAALAEYYLLAADEFSGPRYAELADEFGGEVIPFEVNDDVRKILDDRLAKVSNGHFQSLHNELTQLIMKALGENKTRPEITKLVADHVDNSVATWQVKRLVDTETANAYRQATYLTDLQYLRDTDQVGKAYKVWQTNGPNPCAFCKALNGTRVPFETPFFKVGDTVEANEVNANGQSRQVYYKINHVDINAGEIHPNGHCGYRLEIEA